MNNNIVTLSSQNTHVKLEDDLNVRINILTSLLALALPYVEEMASLTESDDDAYLAVKIKEKLKDD